MTRLTSTATAMVAVIFAAAVSPTDAAAAEPPPGAKAARAEIQLGLCGSAEQIVQALDLRPRGTPIEVWQFDDATLILLEHGLRMRLRVAADGRSELTLKVADQDCARLARDLVPSGEGKCEYDVYGAGIAGAVSLTRHLGAKSTDALIAGRAAPAQVLSPAQVRYLREVVKVWPLPPGIRALGPMHVRTYRTRDGHYDVDVSELPGGAHYAEISRKVPVPDTTRMMEVMEADLARAGVAKCADQSSQAANKLRSLLR
jgi:hypothetical protein